MNHLARIDDQECTCGDPECADCYRSQRAADLAVIERWKEAKIPGDPPLDVEQAISREQVRLMEVP